MKKNMGLIDKSLRLVVVAILVSLYLFDVIAGTTALVVMGVVSFAFVVTALSGYCPAYTLLGFTTCPAAKKEA